MTAGNTTLARKLKMKNVRAQLQLTQQQLADLAGISLKTVWNAENKETISRLNAFAVLRIFNPIRTDIGLPELDIEDLDWKIRGDGE